MRNMRFDPPITGLDLLDALRRTDHLFMNGSNAGVLPVNFNADRNAFIYKGQFLCLGEDEAQCLEYLMYLADVLPVTSSYDRD